MAIGAHRFGEACIGTIMRAPLRLISIVPLVGALLASACSEGNPSVDDSARLVATSYGDFADRFDRELCGALRSASQDTSLMESSWRVLLDLFAQNPSRIPDHVSSFEVYVSEIEHGLALDWQRLGFGDIDEHHRIVRLDGGDIDYHALDWRSVERVSVTVGSRYGLVFEVDETSKIQGGVPGYTRVHVACP